MTGLKVFGNLVTTKEHAPQQGPQAELSYNKSEGCQTILTEQCGKKMDSDFLDTDWS